MDKVKLFCKAARFTAIVWVGIGVLYYSAQLVNWVGSTYGEGVAIAVLLTIVIFSLGLVVSSDH